MKRNFRICATVLLLLTVLFPLTNPMSARAATTQPAGIIVAPALLSFTIQPGAGIQTNTLTITNSYDISQRLVADIQAIDETSARLVPTGPVNEVLARAIKLSATDITIPAHGNFTLQVAVDATSLSDGGHYASLVLTQRSSTTVPSGFLSAVSVNLFIIKNENIRTNLQLTKFHTNRTLFTLPTSAAATFRNLGNTHIVPRASVSIFDGQTLIAKSVVNANSQLVFPNQQANFTAPFEIYGNLLLPRKLQLKMMYRIDSSDIQLLKEQTFWYIPIIDPIVLISFGAIIWWRRQQLRKLFNTLVKALPTAQHRNKRVITKQRVATRRTTTKRILGRTVIRSHLASTRLVLKSSPRLQETHGAPSIDTQSAQKRIAVTIAEETVATPTSIKSEKPKTKRATVAASPKSKTPLKKPKTVKTTAIKSIKTTKPKSPKKSIKTGTKKTNSKLPKNTIQSKHS